MQHFWDKVEKTETCWNWLGKLSEGYGRIGYKKKSYLAHRFSWFLAYGEFPKPLMLHKCNNRKCVNPQHLYPGTHKDNSRDMYMAGTAFNARGENHYQTTLTDLQVKEIKNIYRKGSFGYKKLGKKYGVSHLTIRNIILERTWRHIVA